MNVRVLCLLTCLLVATGVAAAGNAKAQRRFKDAQKAEQAGDLVRAYLLYAEAAALDPPNPLYWLRSKALETRATALARTKTARLPSTSPPAAGTAQGASTLEPFEKIAEGELAEALLPQPPMQLKASRVRKNLDFHGGSRVLFEQVARAYGLNAVFEPDYPPGTAFRFRLADADYADALRALESATGSFVIPLGDRLFLVARDTPQNRAEYEPAVSMTVPIPEPVTLQEAQELMRGVQQVMNLTRIALDSERRIVLMRDRLAKIGPAVMLFQQLLRHRAQVSIELEFLESRDTASTSYGLSLPALFPIVNFGGFWNSKPVIPQAFTRFLTFGGGATFLGIGVTDAGALARMDRSRVRTLLQTEIRSLDGQPASLHVGDRFPMVTAAFLGQLTGEAAAIPPAFNFEDLGVIVKITPRVHGTREITLEVEAEFKVLTGNSVNGIPVVASRKLQSAVRLVNGQWAVVAGLVSVEAMKTATGPAGLAGLPYLAPLFRNNTVDTAVGEIYLLLKPVLLNNPPGEAPAPAIQTGSETRPFSPL